jgi:acid stress-induced BolA-like protein IbaG/YrbA
MYFRGKGSDLTSQVNVTGGGNVFNVAMIGDKHSQIISVSGDDNHFNLSQTSTGASGSSMVISQTGTGTTYNVQQSGSVDNVLSINSVSNGGSFNILQRR